MVYHLIIQADKEGTANTIKLTDNSFYNVSNHISDWCNGARITEKDHKRLVKGQNIVIFGDKEYEIALA